MMSLIKQRFEESIATKQSTLKDAALISKIEEIANLGIVALRNGGKIIFCGNGGSAVDSMHLAAELSGRYYVDRPPLNAESLSADNAFLTAVANDYGYEYVFSRLLRAKGKKGDILIGMSTSGNSKNIVEAFKVAKEVGVTAIGWTGSKSCLMDDCDVLLKVPSSDTPRIQETQMLIGHIICEIIEKHFIENPL
jgi:D-sedoheptulose 7-phosphate isomerase